MVSGTADEMKRGTSKPTVPAGAKANRPLLARRMRSIDYVSDRLTSYAAAAFSVARSRKK